jgi:hypothetical protein
MFNTPLKAHYDGERIVLDEPFALPKDAALLVTVLPDVGAAEIDAVEISEETWLQAIAKNEAFAFLADPAEDIYTLADGEPFRDEA